MAIPMITECNPGTPPPETGRSAETPERALSNETERRMLDHVEQRMPRLLAIDDSIMIHRLLKARLKDERLEIHCAITGEQGLETARRLLPEVILLDIDIPDLNGFELLTQLKADPLMHDIPVIMLSAASDTETKIRGLETGAVDFITKPFDIGELKARVRSAVRIRTLISMLAKRAQLDGLTGLWNRAYFDLKLCDEVSVALRHKTPLSLLFCDIDHFKRLNDSFGHPFGDQVLEEVGRMFGGGRSGDITCRYGGEEFVMILPRTSVDEAAIVAERCRQTMSRHVWAGREGLTVTGSFGVTDMDTAREPTPLSMIDSADRALYAAKKGGRNRVMIASGESSAVRLSA